MRINIVIEEELIRKGLKHTGFKTKKRGDQLCIAGADPEEREKRNSTI